MAWYKLKNKTATLFYDPISGLKLTAATDGAKGWVPEVVEYKGKTTRRISEAIKAGAIEVVEEPTSEKLAAQEKFHAEGSPAKEKKGKGKEKDLKPEESGNKPSSLAQELGAKTLEELQAYYEETYDVSSKDLKAFNKLSKEEAVAWILSLEEE